MSGIAVSGPRIVFVTSPDAPDATEPDEVHRQRLADSRRRLLLAIGPSRDVTFIRTLGNLGDQLIWAGARRLLAERIDREVDLFQAARLRGRTAVLSGGGAWCQPFHEILPRLLPVLEDRFERVIIFPSSFDLEVDEVREALSRSRAKVFARENESYRQITGICDAELALDTAFFFDPAPYRAGGPGRGILHAYRTDAESGRLFALPDDNDDISLTQDSLDAWLWTIARHAVVRTDRAHVMIAAALLGKTVEYRASSYHKLPAIAEYALDVFPVVRLEEPGGGRAALVPSSRSTDVASLIDSLTAAGERSFLSLPEDARRADGPLRITVVLLTSNQPDETRTALNSLAAHVRIPYRVLVVDNHSSEPAREDLRAHAAADPRIDTLFLDRNEGTAGGRLRAVARADTETVFFLDNDAEVFPGTIERLLDELDRHPEALATSARVVLPDGRIQICGGDVIERAGVVSFAARHAGRPFDDAEIEESVPCAWLPGCAVLVRRAAFEEFPLDPGMARYYEDNEWSMRVARARPGALRCASRALALHHQRPQHRVGSSQTEIFRALPFLETIAHFYRKHVLVLDGIFGFVPEFVGSDGVRNVPAARATLDLIASRGGAFFLRHWLSGSLGLFLEGEVDALFARERRSLDAFRASRWWRLANAYWSVSGRLRALLPGAKPE
jgi:GT2 family glycosyltransferase